MTIDYLRVQVWNGMLANTSRYRSTCYGYERCMNVVMWSDMVLISFEERWSGPTIRSKHDKEKNYERSNSDGYKR
jgi:hypothetical protein